MGSFRAGREGVLAALTGLTNQSADLKPLRLKISTLIGENSKRPKSGDLETIATLIQLVYQLTAKYSKSHSQGPLQSSLPGFRYRVPGIVAPSRCLPQFCQDVHAACYSKLKRYAS